MCYSMLTSTSATWDEKSISRIFSEYLHREILFEKYFFGKYPFSLAVPNIVDIINVSKPRMTSVSLRTLERRSVTVSPIKYSSPGYRVGICRSICSLIMVLQAIIKPTALIGILLSSRRLRNTPGLAFPLRTRCWCQTSGLISIGPHPGSTAADPEASRNCTDYPRPEYFNPICVCVWICNVCVCEYIGEIFNVLALSAVRRHSTNQTNYDENPLPR